MTHRLRTPFTIGLVLGILLALTGAFIKNNNLLIAGVGFLGAILILAGAAIGLFQHTELLVGDGTPVPFKDLSRSMVITAIVIAILCAIGGAALLIWAGTIPFQ